MMRLFCIVSIDYVLCMDGEGVILDGCFDKLWKGIVYFEGGSGNFLCIYMVVMLGCFSFVKVVVRIIDL